MALVLYSPYLIQRFVACSALVRFSKLRATMPWIWQIFFVTRQLSFWKAHGSLEIKTLNDFIILHLVWLESVVQYNLLTYSFPHCLTLIHDVLDRPKKALHSVGCSFSEVPIDLGEGLNPFTSDWLPILVEVGLDLIISVTDLKSIDNLIRQLSYLHCLWF